MHTYFVIIINTGFTFTVNLLVLFTQTTFRLVFSFFSEFGYGMFQVVGNFMCNDFLVNRLCGGGGGGAVSYTHLDVYKRQGFGGGV